MIQLGLRQATQHVRRLGGVRRGRRAVSTSSPALVEGAGAAAAPLGSWPPDLIVDALSTLVDVTHLPPWALIVGLTLGVRAALIPLAVSQARTTVGLAKMKPQLAALKKQMAADPMGKQAARQKMYQKQMSELMMRNGGNPLKALIMPLVQLPLFMSFFFGLRKCGDYIPAFSDGGALWFQDLALADSTLILPTVTAASFLLMAEVGVDDSYTDDSSRMLKMRAIMRSLAVLALPLTAHEPSGVFIYWLSNNAFSVTQGLAIRHPGMRKILGIPPKLESSSTSGGDEEEVMAVIRILGGKNPFKEGADWIQQRRHATSQAEAQVLYGGPRAQQTRNKQQQPSQTRPQLFTRKRCAKSDQNRKGNSF